MALRKISATLVVLLASFAFVVKVGADQWVPPSDFVPDSVGVNIVNSFFNSGEGSSFLTGLSAQSSTSSGMPAETLCSGITSSGPCDFDSQAVNLSGVILLPVCTSSSQDECIAGLSIGSDASSMEPATFDEMTSGPTIAADPAHGLPEGSTIGLWTDSVPNAGGSTTYATYAKLQVGFDTATDQYQLENLSVQVLPYVEQSGSYNAPVNVQMTNATTGLPQVSNNGQYLSCAWSQAGECGRLEDFVNGTEVSVSVRLSKQIGGWFQGRMQSPSINISPFDSSDNLITVSAESVETPMLYTNIPVSEETPAIEQFFSQIYGVGTENINDDYPNAIPAVDAFRSVANDTASGVINQWSFGSYNSSGNSCMSNTSSVLGIVTTNAMVFSPQAPTFANGTLSYQVAGMHFMPDGTTPVQGVYDMVMSDAVARCLYGFTTAPISGSVSVSEGSSGDTNVATTSVTDSNGWLHLAAYGFEFSDPTINATLTQAKAPAVKAKSVTITCVGKTNKKLKKLVSGTKPVCPGGYKPAS